MTSSELPSCCPLERSEGGKVIFTVCGEGLNMTKTSQPFLNGPSTGILKNCLTQCSVGCSGIVFVFMLLCVCVLYV